MAGRQIFSQHEKLCLQELITKFKLNTTIGARNPVTKKIAWARLTEEYNSRETNCQRTEAQLKKCWDNLKTRRKQMLARQKREQIRTGGGPDIPAISSTSSTHDEFEEVLLDCTDTELQGVIDSDFNNQDAVEEFGWRLENNQRAQEREEELHQLKVEERQWLNKAAQEAYKKAVLERESAKELLRCNRAKRELAERMLGIQKNKMNNINYLYLFYCTYCLMNMENSK